MISSQNGIFATFQHTSDPSLSDVGRIYDSIGWKGKARTRGARILNHRELPPWLIMLMTHVLIPAFSAAGGVGLLVLLFRSYLLEKIKASIQHDYDLKLESHRDALKRQGETQLEQLRQFNAEQIGLQNAAFTAFQVSHGAAFERRLSAVDALWDGFLKVTEKIPPALTYLDILLETEYPKILENPQMESVIRDLSDKQSLALVRAGGLAEPNRPFAHPELYAIFYVYRAILGRIIWITKNGYEKGSIPYWPKDSVVQQYLNVVLSEEEVISVKDRLVGPYVQVRGLLEAKFLALAQKIVLGQESAEQILEVTSNILMLREIDTRAER